MVKGMPPPPVPGCKSTVTPPAGMAQPDPQSGASASRRPAFAYANHMDANEPLRFQASYDEELSQSMSGLLRFKFVRRGLKVNSAGFAYIREVANNLQKTIEEIENVVEHSSKRGQPRFEIIEYEGHKLIRSTRKHRVEGIDVDRGDHHQDPYLWKSSGTDWTQDSQRPPPPPPPEEEPTSQPSPQNANQAAHCSPENVAEELVSLRDHVALMEQTIRDLQKEIEKERGLRKEIELQLKMESKETTASFSSSSAFPSRGASPCPQLSPTPEQVAPPPLPSTPRATPSEASPAPPQALTAAPPEAPQPQELLARAPPPPTELPPAWSPAWERAKQAESIASPADPTESACTAAKAVGDTCESFILSDRDGDSAVVSDMSGEGGTSAEVVAIESVVGGDEGEVADATNEPALEAVLALPRRKAKADFDPKDYGDEYIALRKGEDVILFETDPSGWAYGEVNGYRGWFPETYV